MSPILHSRVLKSFLAFSIVLLHVQAFAQNTYTAQSSGSFTTLSIWKDAKGNVLTSQEYATGLVNFVISNQLTVTLEGTATIGTLSLETGGTLNLSSGNLTIQGDLNINTITNKYTSALNFGTSNNLVTLTGSLNGNENSVISHNAASKFKNELILKGKTNSLDVFTNKSTGISIVRYAGASQTVFNSDSYKDLYLEGSGTKVLSSLSKTTLDGTTVTHLFSITNARLRLGDFNFSYSGQQSSLSYTDGWVITNGAGLYKNLIAESTVTFPVGDAKNMQVIRISDSKVSTALFQVAFSGFNAFNTTNGSIDNGMGVWYVTSSDVTSASITLVQPVASSSSLASTSKIALYNTAWRTQTTSYDSKIKEYSSNVTLTNKDINSIGMVTCPTFSLSATTLPEATTGEPYSQDALISGTTGKISIINASSSPAGFSITQGKDITFSNEKPGKDNYTINFTVRDTLRCETALKVQINIKSTTTTWDGKSWSNGFPTAAMDVILQANYTSDSKDSLKAKNISINEKVTLNIKNGSTVTISGTAYNNGAIVLECGAIFTYNGLKGNDIKDYNPVILPESLDPGIAGQDYKAYFTANDSPDNLTIANVPVNFTFSKGLLVNSKPLEAGLVNFKLTYSDNGCTVEKNYSIKVIDLPSPNLSIAAIGSKTVEDNAFKLGISTRSKGNITYSILSGACATIGASTGIVVLNCADQVTVQVTQDASDLYKAQTVTQTFTILPAKGKLLVRNFAFIVNENNPIRLITKSTGAAISFDQVKGFNNATVDAAGNVVPKTSGAFAVHISVAATQNYTAFDSIYIFNVVSLLKPPVAVADTIVLETGKDTTFNILNNDIGMTEAITSDHTDIDIENDGVQIKYYATELGNFIIDADGNLTVKPFSGFIGSSRIGYTVTDVNGLTSDISYINVTVKPPYEIPELKANEVMTPNNDNINDALVIANTDINNGNSISIMDEIGNTVYEKVNYQNDWEGIDKNNNKLEAGVYFYVFKESTTGRELNKYIQIIK